MMAGLLARAPHLTRNFENSVFACATANFGPQTATFRHSDTQNLPYGWCAITALGSYDYTRGGHLVLWEAGLVLEFPPGSTILIPLATISHSNIAIQPGETRYSFTQYTSGSLFRWVDQEILKEKTGSGVDGDEENDLGKSIDEVLSLFSTFEEL